MDYEGQRLSELIFYWIILSLGAVGWVIGYFQQDFYIVFQFWLVGVVLSVIVSSTMGGNVFLHQEVWLDAKVPCIPHPLYIGSIYGIIIAVRTRLAVLQPTSREMAGICARSTRKEIRVCVTMLGHA